MVCPVLNKRPEKEWSTEYPFEPLYRPWSWILSSSFNIFILLVLLGTMYMLYKRWKSKRRNVTYRSLKIQKASEDKVNALVTGGNGTLGKEVVRCLLEDGGYNVHSLDLLLPEDANRNENVCRYLQTDITNVDDLLIAFKEIDVVFHVAGIVPQIYASDDYMHKVNVVGTENVIRACKDCHVKRLIYTSSVGVLLGKDPKQVVDRVDETYPLPEVPFNAYSRTKGAAETLVRKANGTGGLLTCALRPGTILSPVFMKSSLSNPVIVGDGKTKYAYVPLRATAEAHLLADKKLCKEGETSVAAGGVYHLCLEEDITLRDLAEFLASEIGKKAENVSHFTVTLLAYANTIVYTLTGMILISPFLTVQTSQFLKRSNTMTSVRAHKELGWPALPPWKEAFSQAVKDYLGESKKDK